MADEGLRIGNALKILFNQDKIRQQRQKEARQARRSQKLETRKTKAEIEGLEQKTSGEPTIAELLRTIEAAGDPKSELAKGAAQQLRDRLGISTQVKPEGQGFGGALASLFTKSPEQRQAETMRPDAPPLPEGGRIGQIVELLGAFLEKGSTGSAGTGGRGPIREPLPTPQEAAITQKLREPLTQPTTAPAGSGLPTVSDLAEQSSQQAFGQDQIDPDILERMVDERTRQRVNEIDPTGIPTIQQAIEAGVLSEQEIAEIDQILERDPKQITEILRRLRG